MLAIWVLLSTHLSTLFWSVDASSATWLTIISYVAGNVVYCTPLHFTKQQIATECPAMTVWNVQTKAASACYFFPPADAILTSETGGRVKHSVPNMAHHDHGKSNSKTHGIWVSHLAHSDCNVWCHQGLHQFRANEQSPPAGSPELRPHSYPLLARFLGKKTLDFAEESCLPAICIYVLISEGKPFIRSQELKRWGWETMHKTYIWRHNFIPAPLRKTCCCSQITLKFVIVSNI